MSTAGDIYGADFYTRSALLIARDLLGARLVRQWPDGTRLSGRIVETEAYTQLDDLASHAVRYRRTPRNEPMWRAPGITYVYLTYGLHWLLNIVVEPVEQPAAVLIRAIEPLEGIEVMQHNRPHVPARQLTNGPARLTMALGIDKAMNQRDITTPAAGLWIEADQHIPDSTVSTGPRIGLGQTPEPWLSMPWRWWVTGHPYISK